MNTNFLLGSGYYHRPGEVGGEWFFQLWLENTLKVCEIPDIAILANGGCRPAILANDKSIILDGNVGHVHDILGKSNTPKPHEYCGWSMTMLTLAMLAYNDEKDFIYKEADCLAFGGWVDQLYTELGERSMLFGKSKVMPCSQSLFIIRHRFIPTFVAEYIRLGSERKIENLPETKFVRLEQMFQKDVGRFSFPFDRDRPLDYTLPVWYGQKFTRTELLELRKRDLVAFDQFPEGVERFTND